VKTSIVVEAGVEPVYRALHNYQAVIAIEIPAVRDLLKAFASLAAAVVTIDAMHTQSDTAQVIKAALAWIGFAGAMCGLLTSA
jgi:hypothetical protein